MLDIRYIRDHAKEVQKKAEQKGYSVDISELLRLDEKRRNLLAEIDELRQERNRKSAGFGKGGKPSEDELRQGLQMRQAIAEKEKIFKTLEEEYLELLKQVPNMPLPEVPVGASEDENVVVRSVGEPPKFEFAPKNHDQLAVQRGWLDKERAARVAGTRFAYLKGDLVRLHWAVLQFALNHLTDEATLRHIIETASLKISAKPFVPVLPPLMIRTEPYDAMDRLEPRDERYKIEGEELWLQGSAEHVLGSMHAGEIFDEADLPLRYAGYATSFRKEAGTYGKDMEGIFRLHQFDKLEMESFTVPEDGPEEYKLMVAIQEYLMQQLGLPYRVLRKCTADIGKPNAAGTDIDTWLPGQGKYRETHTADYMTDYQSRRLQTRVRRANGTIELVHTNDATAFSQRPLIALLENFQQADGTILLPEVLRPYLGGRSVL